MKSGKLLVIGNKKICQTFGLLGGISLELNHDNESSIIDYLETNKERVGGIIITSDVNSDKNSKMLRKIEEFDIPWIILSVGHDDKATGYKKLEMLAEKAIGLKINYK
jgi:vacuolar-type H+-ATPase subunit F/Vma7